MFDLARGFRFFLLLTLITLVIYLIMVGCGGGGSSGVTPDLPGDPPETSIVTDLPDEVIRQGSITLTVTGSSETTSTENLSYEWRAYKNGILVQGWVRVSGADIVINNLSTGEWLVQIRAIDQDGQPDPTPLEITFVVDYDGGTAPPDTSIDSGCPDGTWFQDSIILTVSGTSGFTPPDEITFEYRTLRNGVLQEDWTAHPGPEITVQNLTTGDWIVNIRAIDSEAQADLTPEECHFPANLEDTTLPPETSIDSGCPEGFFTESSLTLTVSGSSEITAPGDITFDYRTYQNGILDTAWTAFTGNSLLLENLTTGDWQIHVRAVDEDGRVDETPAECNFQIDEPVTAPDTTITSGCPETEWPNDYVTLTVTGSSTFTPSEELTYEYRTSANGIPVTDWSYAPGSVLFFDILTVGYWEIDIRAVDSEGRVDPSPAECNFTFNPDAPDPCENDTIPPDTTLTFGCFDYDVGTTSITFGVSGSDNCTQIADLSYQYHKKAPGSSSFDTWSAHYSSEAILVEGLYDGIWNFEFRAVDELQNPDPSPVLCANVAIAGNPCDLDLTPPVTGITSGKSSYPSGTTFITLGVSAYDNCTPSSEITFDYHKKLQADPFYDSWTSHYACETIDIPGLYDGIWEFEVRGVDASGNPDTNPAYFGPVDISGAPDPCDSDSTPPETSIVSGCTSYPEGTIEVTIDVSGTDNCTESFNLTYQYHKKGPGYFMWDTWSSHYSSESLVIGSLYQGIWEIEVRATDESNNTDLTPAFCDSLEIAGPVPADD